MDPAFLAERGLNLEELPLAVAHAEFRPIRGLERFRRLLQRPVADDRLCRAHKGALVEEVIRRGQGQQECRGQRARRREPDPKRFARERFRLHLPRCQQQQQQGERPRGEGGPFAEREPAQPALAQGERRRLGVGLLAGEAEVGPGFGIARVEPQRPVVGRHRLAKSACLEVRVAEVEQEVGGHAVRAGGPVKGGGLGELAGFVQAIGLLKLRLAGGTRVGKEQGGGAEKVECFTCGKKKSDKQAKSSLIQIRCSVLGDTTSLIE